MGKTHIRVDKEEIERNPESPAHKQRRELDQRLKQLIEDDEYDEYHDDFVSFERIKPRSKRR